MTHQISIDYRDATLCLSFEDTPSALLEINGMKRDQATSGDVAATLRLGSSVQTDYEWHEYIEGIVEYHPGKVVARLIASNVELAIEEIKRDLV